MATKSGRGIAGKPKPKARTKSPKPPAKKAPAGRRRGEKMPSGWRRNVADRWVIHWRVFEKQPWKAIVAKDGRQERTLRRVVDDYLANVESGDAVRPLERDPLDLIESMVNELMVMRDTMLGIIQSSADERVTVTAAREWRRLVKEVRELLQGVGKLPRELGTMRHLVEAGEISAQELRAQVAEWAGVKQLPAGSGDDAGEPVDAEVVPDPDGVG